MVSVERLDLDNTFEWRDYLCRKAVEGGRHDPFQLSLLFQLGLSGLPQLETRPGTLSLYQRCAVAGLGLAGHPVEDGEIFRLLGQASQIDGTPREWVSDIFGVMAVKWLVGQPDHAAFADLYARWIGGFLSQQVSGGHLNEFEKDIATYILKDGDAVFATAAVPLFLHYDGKSRIDDHGVRRSLIQHFMAEFRAQSVQSQSAALIAMMVFVFDRADRDIATVPPGGWSHDDLLRFLEHIPVGLKRWTYEEKGRTKGAKPVRWLVENEYHVQNLLYVLLGPIFNNISDEVYLQPIGQKTPRVDLYLPSLHTIIEVKYRKDTKKSFQSLIGEVAEDATLYRADDTYKDARIVAFLWDCTRATQEHAKFKEGVLKFVDGCTVISAPSTFGGAHD
jgi:hypothetical protein